MQKLALFDFDGTISKNDSFIAFLKFARGNFVFAIKMLLLSPILILYKIGIVSNTTTKQLVFNSFFKNFPITKFEETAELFTNKILKNIIRHKMINRINWHKKNGHKVVVVTANFEYILKPWCAENNLTLIATKLKVKQGILTGQLDGLNCYGKEKARRITKEFDLSTYEYIYAYGDSKGDIDMLQLADEYYYREMKNKIQ